MSLALTCLGDFQVTVDHQPVIFATNPTRALLTYLALEGGSGTTRAHHRETLADLLWPNYLESAARLNLSQTLARLRRALHDAQGAPPLLQITRQTIQLDPTAVTVDVWHFQRLLAACTQHPHAELTSCPTCCAQLTSAATLYTGPLLAGALWTDSQPFAEWLLLKREQLQRQALDALHALAVHHTAAGAYDQVQHYAQRQLALEPWRETAHRQVMSAFALAGHRSAALAHYESCRRSLREELAVEPDAATVALVERIRKEDFRLPIVDFRVAEQQAKIHNQKSKISSDAYSILARLEPLPDQQLFGMHEAEARLTQRLCAVEAPWILAIDGIGGIGKTALATVLVHRVMASVRFANIAWVSAQQTNFSSTASLPASAKPALDEATLTDALLAQLLEGAQVAASNPEKRATLTRLLKAEPYLVVVDNLETVADYTALAPFLQQLANPSKFLLTSRVRLQRYSGIYCYTVHELSEADALAFVCHEAEVRGIGALIDAKQAQLAAIYQVVGGNPLALKLVIGQLLFLPLAHVLEDLRRAQSQPIHDLYTHIYWQAWQLLDEASRQLFLILPVETNSTYPQLAALGILTPEQLQRALAQLIALSLVQVGGDLEQPRYTLHRLTETFLMHEVLQWQTA